MPIVPVVWLVVVVAGSLVVGIHMVRRQQRIYRDSDGPADLYRADDLEAGGPFDPKAGPQAAEDFFAGGGRASGCGELETSRAVHTIPIQVHPPRVHPR
jgi:hypothetical protein